MKKLVKPTFNAPKVSAYVFESGCNGVVGSFSYCGLKW